VDDMVPLEEEIHSSLELIRKTFTFKSQAPRGFTKKIFKNEFILPKNILF
jgi:hypothetical protein